MHLALEVGVSPRHLSFVETGRSKPSPELVESIAEELEVPLRERNTLLLAAGYAPALPRADARRSRDAIRGRVRAADARRPRSRTRACVIDRQWNIVRANAAASALTVGPAAGGARAADQRLPGVPAPRRPRGADAELPGMGRATSSASSSGPLALTGRSGAAGAPRRGARVPERRGRRSIGPSVPVLDDVPLLVPLRLQAGDGGALAVHDAHHVRHAARRHPRRARGRALLPGRRGDRARAARRRSGVAASGVRQLAADVGQVMARLVLGVHRDPPQRPRAPARGSCRRACGPTGRRRAGRARA